jgi:hypothetical protein
MSKEAIQAVVHELEFLPESDQQLVLDFLATLKRQRQVTEAPASNSETSAAIENREGLLVFTGKVDLPDADWVRVVREERDEEVMQAALGRLPHS